MKKRSAAIVVVSLCAAFLLLPAAAGAQGASPFDSITMKGKVQPSGKKFRGQYTVDKFIQRGGKTYAVGDLIGKTGRTRVSRSNLAVPVQVMPSGQVGAAQAVCPILTLVLGPLDLNLLGLRVQLNQVILRITAIRGPGNLLGNLLCNLVGLLDPPTAAGALNPVQVTGVLNLVLTLINNPALGQLNAPAAAAPPAVGTPAR